MSSCVVTICFYDHWLLFCASFEIFQSNTHSKGIYISPLPPPTGHGKLKIDARGKKWKRSGGEGKEERGEKKKKGKEETGRKKENK